MFTTGHPLHPFKEGIIFIYWWCRQPAWMAPMKIPSREGQKASAFGVGLPVGDNPSSGGE